ncbi:hypothetical protein [Microbacterium sediminis]|uniref:Uncharacterized protein n=1 Tax=Microbacterium sediminis TaxID=904291 RepID=A0A1B9N827_9MICO|nr:hypothetical protein [Microbacterium sediminis]OCG72747.1 hypothetical protein A7J15_10985 [Microbacterium sediminis]QBR74737.1 DNA modification methylase [Microbacterium sediminis]
MNSRSLASLALGGLVVLGTAGCAAITHQATTIQYSPADGVNIPVGDDSPVEILNTLIVANEDGTDGNLVAAFVNKTDEPVTVTLSWNGGGAEVDVPADETLSLGGEDDPVLLEGIDTPAGATLPIAFSTGGEPVQAEVQVFDEELGYLEGLAPSE